MTFTFLGRLVAWAAIGMGILLAAIGFLFASFVADPAQIQQYFTAENTGQLIDKGMYYILFGIGFGILTDISRSVAKASIGKAPTPTTSTK